MEGLSNPYYSDIKEIYYPLNLNKAFCSSAGIWYLEREARFFGIKEIIIKLGGIINKLLFKLDSMVEENKEITKKLLQEKEELLIELIFQFEEIEKKYTEEDKYFREDLFEFYAIKYRNLSIFSFLEKKVLMDAMNEIQTQLRKTFFLYVDKYYQIRNNFFEINNYIIKVKRLFNI
jgi:hypothetical protein